MSQSCNFFKVHFIYSGLIFRSVDVNHIMEGAFSRTYISFVRHSKIIFRIVSNLIHQSLFRHFNIDQKKWEIDYLMYEGLLEDFSGADLRLRSIINVIPLVLSQRFWYKFEPDLSFINLALQLCLQCKSIYQAFWQTYFLNPC